ncbi:MAG: hypothetical protein IKB09_03010 [Oscillospiraceae bacterium]|nr:hypothetical protein [Oscillospiraceae bacterium]MBR2421307.1 hypothetical protein [Oscillospiraceae bacterium]
MTEIQNNLFYTASILEYTARRTKNKRAVIASLIGTGGVRSILECAEVNHCLPFSQVADELIQDYRIPSGRFAPEDHVTKVPSSSEIGKVYMRLVEDAQPDQEKYPEELVAIFTSKIADWMTEYQSAFFYSPRDYILECYREIQQNG